MKRAKVIACVLAACMLLGLIAGCSAQEPASAGETGGDVMVALITMDSIDQHWITLREGADKAAAELGVLSCSSWPPTPRTTPSR